MSTEKQATIDIDQTEQEERGTLTFIASTPTKDKDGDRVSDNWRFPSHIPFLFAHDQKAPPLGHIENPRVVNKKLIVDVVFDEEDEFAQAIKRKYINGHLKGVSVGFTPIDLEPMESGFHYLEQRLDEVSAVSIPSHEESEILRSMDPNVVKGFFDGEPIVTKAIPDELHQELDAIEDETSSKIQSIQSDLLEEWREKVRDGLEDSVAAKDRFRNKFRPKIRQALEEQANKIADLAEDQMKQDLRGEGLEGLIGDASKTTTALDQGMNQKIRQKADVIVDRITNHLADQTAELEFRTPSERQLPVGTIGLDALKKETLNQEVQKVTGTSMNVGRQRVIDEVDANEPGLVMCRREVEARDEKLCSECRTLDGEVAVVGSAREQDLTPPAHCLGQGNCRCTKELFKVGPRNLKSSNKPLRFKNKQFNIEELEEKFMTKEHRKNEEEEVVTPDTEEDTEQEIWEALESLKNQVNDLSEQLQNNDDSEGDKEEPDWDNLDIELS